MLELRRERQKRPWQNARWWAWVCALFFISSAVAFERSPEVPWYQRQIFTTASHLGSSAQTTRGWWKHLWQSDAAEAVATLHQEIARLETALQSAEEWRHERDQLRAILGIATAPNQTLVGARVVQHNLRAPYKTIVINKGTEEGVAKGMIAVADGGLAGRVAQVTNHHATILLLNDPSHAVDVVVQRSRARGILVGRGSATTLGQMLGVSRIEYIDGQSDIETGDVMVTSGLDGRYPSGLVVGTVRRVTRSQEGFLRHAEVVPLVDWKGIERVGLLTQRSHP